MTKDEAIAAAETTARERGWPWEPPFLAHRVRRWWLFGPVLWDVRSNAERRGQNVNVVLDDATGAIISSTFAPR